MAQNSLADYLETLEKLRQLARVTAEVETSLELAEITRRVAKVGGPALLFERVRGQTMAVVTNLLGTPGRVCQALGIDALDEIATRTDALIQQNTPQNWFDRLKTSADEVGANKFRPKTIKSGPCQQVVRLGRDIDLAALPLVKQWPRETGPSLTAGQLITQARGQTERSATILPLQAIDQNRLAAIDDGHSDFSLHWSAYHAAGEKMPVVVVLGGDPALTVAASLDLPSAVDFYHLAGLLRGAAIDVVKCRTHELETPAEADLVLEGYFDPADERVVVEAAGAGGSHYRMAEPASVLHLTAITHRSHPVIPILIDTGQHGETGSLVTARQRLLLPALRSIAPEIVDISLPIYGGPHRYAFVAIRKTYPYHSRQVASALWGSAAVKFTKFIILVDADVNVHDAERVLTEVGANVSPERDVFSHDGAVHGSDHASASPHLGRHLGIDATSKIAGEQSGAWPRPLVADPQIEQMVTSRWAEYKLDLAAQIR